jgi:hypothetical protein
MPANVLLSGVFRSGTTLLSRVLSAHPDALVVSDPSIYFFKAYRDFHFEQAGLERDVERPNSSLFMDPYVDVWSRILAADLSETMPDWAKRQVREQLRDWKTAQHPRLVAEIESVDGESFRDFFASLLALLATLYGNENTRLVGAKTSWCEAFIPALGRAFPEMKFVFMVRDLRAVIASQNQQRGVGEGTRPLLFYVHHWRKSVAFAMAWGRLDPVFSKRCAVVRYEDLISDLAGQLRPINRLLDLACHPHQFNAERWPDERMEGRWTPNSSYHGQKQGLYSSSVDRWRTSLSGATVRAVEALAGPELALMGYDLERPIASVDAYLAANVEPDFESLAPWLKPYPEAEFTRDPMLRRAVCAAEARRRAMIRSAYPADCRRSRGLLIDPRMAALLRPHLLELERARPVKAQSA